MKTKETSSNISIDVGFVGLLQVAFIVLKLCNVINWSWWWVLAPIWMPVALALAVILIVVIVLAIKGD